MHLNYTNLSSFELLFLLLFFFCLSNEVASKARIQMKICWKLVFLLHNNSNNEVFTALKIFKEHRDRDKEREKEREEKKKKKLFKHCHWDILLKWTRTKKKCFMFFGLEQNTTKRETFSLFSMVFFVSCFLLVFSSLLKGKVYN